MEDRPSGRRPLVESGEDGTAAKRVSGQGDSERARLA